MFRLKSIVPVSLEQSALVKIQQDYIMAMFSWLLWSLCVVSILCIHRISCDEWIDFGVHVSYANDEIICPKKCSCYSWSSNNVKKTYDRFTVNCSGIRTDVRFIPENTTDLVVANYYRQQPPGMILLPFIIEHDEDRERLIMLALRRYGINKIHSSTRFVTPLHLDRLHYIDLSENTISEIQLDTSNTSFHNLTAISLAGNIIGHLQGSFLKSKQVRLINISNNGLWNMDPLAFHEVPNLEVLDLSRNDLTRLPWDDISKLSSLKILALEDNPWVCSCDIMGILKLKRSLLNGTGATCKHPSTLNGTLLKNLNSDFFIRCQRLLYIIIIINYFVSFIERLFSYYNCFIYCLVIYIIYKQSVTPLVPDTVPGIITLRYIKFDINATLDKFGKVYRGSLLSDGQEAAIKKHPKMEVCEELRHFLHLNTNARPHPNIIRYYAWKMIQVLPT